MSAPDLLASLAAQPRARPALCAATQRLTYGELCAVVEARARELRARGIRVLASQLDNGIDWIVADLAALHVGIVHVPLPLFFTEAQRAHALRASGADALLASEDSRSSTLVALVPEAAPTPHRGTAKITFTSGTTGTPKGVCLSAPAMLAVARGLADALAPLRIERHLCALPLAVLLENLAGVYAPLLAGACVVVLPLGEVGLEGSSRFDAARLDAAVAAWDVHSVIVLPQMLRAWSAWRGARQPQGHTLRFVAAGGAPVGAANLAQARAAGLPAYEGYGLSEGASVQTLNLPGADRPGSAGRVSPHARVRISAAGEIEIAGSVMLGYLGAAPAPQWWPSGDSGTLDADGFLHVQGRRNDVIVTAFGRNVAPEWVETALQSRPGITQAAVFGKDAPALAAVLWPARAELPDAELERAVREANATLPDYARIASWRRARLPFDAASGMATANGRPRRAAIATAHGLAANDFFRTPATMQTFHQRLLAETASARAQLQAVPIVQATLRGEVSLASYVAFLAQAFHHVRHTVPLLAACRDALPPRLAWLAPALDEYIAEESGHDLWILDDLAACGTDPEAVRAQRPAPATELMVAYAYDTIARGNPVGFLGMVHVLEGTSVALALAAADRIQAALALPDSAFSYLRSHGTLDREHVATFARLVDAIDDAADRATLLHAARMFYRLYADVFRGLPQATAGAPHNQAAIA